MRALTLLLTATFRLAAANADLNRVAEHMLTLVTSQADPDTADTYAASLLQDGSWSDINYADMGRSPWSPSKHMTRLVSLATAACVTNGRDSLVSATHSALGFWLKSDPQSANWYWNDLDSPLRIGDVGVAFRQWLEADELEGLEEIMNRADYTKYSGFNLLSMATVHIKHGVVIRNETEAANSLLDAAFDAIWGEIKISPPTNALDMRGASKPTDGIQADSSFHQHGPQLLAGSYGQGYSKEILEKIQLSDGTKWKVDEDLMELFVGFLLDGQRWMTVGDRWQWSVVGRNQAQPNNRHGDKISLPSYMVELPSVRKPELEAFAAGTPLANGHRAFWCSDYAVHRTQSPYAGQHWVATVHMHSSRTIAAQCVNSQGKLSEHIADGMIFVYYDGSEYDGIFPVWNWQQLPGITAEQRPEGVDSCTYFDQLVHDSESMPLVGTVSDSTSGLSAMALVSHGLTAKKAVAMLPHALVGLVADLDVTSNNEALTTIETRLASGEVWVSTGGARHNIALGTSNESWQDVQWVHHANTGYLILPTAAPLCTKGTRSGSTCCASSCGQCGGVGCGNLPGGKEQCCGSVISKPCLDSSDVACVIPDAPAILLTHALLNGTWAATGTGTSHASEQVFSLSIQHGQRSSVLLRAVAYITIPGVGISEMDSLWASSANLSVTANSAEVQAVVDLSRSQALAVFWEPSSTTVPLSPPITVSADRAATVIVTRESADTYVVTASDPSNDQDGSQLRITLSSPSSALSAEVVLNLPGGYAAGNSTSTRVSMASSIV